MLYVPAMRLENLHSLVDAARPFLSLLYYYLMLTVSFAKVEWTYNRDMTEWY